MEHFLIACVNNAMGIGFAFLMVCGGASIVLLSLKEYNKFTIQNPKR